MADHLYRTGRKLGRTVYRGDELIGIMDTPELGALVVEALNAAVIHDPGPVMHPVTQDHDPVEGGPCSNRVCRLGNAHAGPCDCRTRREADRG